MARQIDVQRYGTMFQEGQLELVPLASIRTCVLREAQGEHYLFIQFCPCLSTET